MEPARIYCFRSILWMNFFAVLICDYSIGLNSVALKKRVGFRSDSLRNIKISIIKKLIGKVSTMADDTKLFDFFRLPSLMIKYLDKQNAVLSAFFKSPNKADPHKDMALLMDFVELMALLAGDSKTLLATQEEYIIGMMKLYDRFGRKIMGIKENKDDPFEILADKRFKSDEWAKNPIFELIRDSYLFSARNIDYAVSQVKGMDEEKKKRVKFFTHQFLEAISPSNYLSTNPELIKLTFESGGENILDGIDNFLNDVNCNDGSLSIKMTTTHTFELGKNLASSPGKVIFQNDLVQLIQYSPTTETVFEVPVLISPPWINKFYILDINEQSSLVRWLVNHGYTVFMISWVNPDEHHAGKSFENYLLEGHVEILDVVKSITKCPKVSAIGYCTGGTLLATTAAYLTAREEDRFASLTYMATLIDFSYPGELGIFTTEDQVKSVVADVKNLGYLDGRHLAKMFSMLRSTDLIWAYAVNNYLKGKEPEPFDILYWNSDYTNLPAKMYNFYLKNAYIENRLKDPDGIRLNGVGINIADITTPAYFLATEEDHIVLWKGAFKGARLHSGPVRFVLGKSGHVSGVVNPPAKQKYGYRFSDDLTDDPEKFLESASCQEGSWWLNWHDWNAVYAGKQIPKRIPGKGKYKSIEDAPGSYVKRNLEEEYTCKESCASCKRSSRSGISRPRSKSPKPV